MNLVRKQLQKMLQTEPRDGGFRATLTLDPNFSILPDHFPGQPILPGMCLVQAVILAAGMNARAEFRLRILKNAKLMAPVQPGETMQIDASVAPIGDGLLAIKAKLTRSEQKVANISLIALAPSPGTSGEGRGEGSVTTTNSASSSLQNPHPTLSRNTWRETERGAS